MNLYRYTTKICTTQNRMTRLWPAYVMRHGPYYVHLVFANEKVCVWMYSALQKLLVDAVDVVGMEAVYQRRAHQMKSLQWLQNVGCLKKCGTNLCPLTSWMFFCRSAPLRCTPPTPEEDVDGVPLFPSALDPGSSSALQLSSAIAQQTNPPPLYSRADWLPRPLSGRRRLRRQAALGDGRWRQSAHADERSDDRRMRRQTTKRGGRRAGRRFPGRAGRQH